MDKATGRQTGLLDPLFGTDDAAERFTDAARLQAMLQVEAALARAEAAVGVIPPAAVAPIEQCCRAALFDFDALAAATASAGNPAIPLVKALTALVRERDPEAARYVHWGATSQDVMDSGLVLQLRAFLDDLEGTLASVSRCLCGLAEREADTLLAGRTWLQQALPTTFGLKAAGWLDALTRHRHRLAELRPRLLVLQFGGAAGTLASLGERGPAVAAALGEALGLGLPALPWHALRDRLGELACWQGLLIGTLGKIARDLSLLMQSEVGEAFEPGGEARGGSSTMPQKRNPVVASVVLSAALQAPGLVATLLQAQVQEHERGLGGWQAEWESLPQLCRLTAGALARTLESLAGLELDHARMAENLAASQGRILSEAVMMALGPKLGRLAAHDLLAAAVRRSLAERRPLRDLLAGDPAVSAALSGSELDALFAPQNYLGAAAAFIAAALAEARTLD